MPIPIHPSADWGTLRGQGQIILLVYMNIKIDYRTLCLKVLQEQLDALGIAYTIKNLGEISFAKALTKAQRGALQQALQLYGIEVLQDQNEILVQRIKDTVTELLSDFDTLAKYNVSTYLAKELHYSYSHLSTIFSEETHTSIENFVILKKIDLAKRLIISKKLTLTEIAYRLSYSSVAHLSAQFKKTTGLTPSAFQNIVEKRKVTGAVP